MQLVAISENTLVNIDMIEAIEVRKLKGNKIFTIVIGGKSYTPTVDSMELLNNLIKAGSVSKVINQFFAV